MDRGTAIGLGLALISILGAAVVEAGSIGILFALLNLPSAMIVFGGTIGTIIVAGQPVRASGRTRPPRRLAGAGDRSADDRGQLDQKRCAAGRRWHRS
jgi:hypothetical protein